MQRGLLIRRGPHFGFSNATSSVTSRPFAASLVNNLVSCGYATEPGRQGKEDALGKTIRKESEAHGSASSIGWNDSPQGRRGDMRDTQRLEERLMAKESKKSSSKEKEDQESDDEGDEDREKRGDWYTKQEEQYSESKSTSQQQKQFDAASDSYNVDNLADGKKEGSSQQEDKSGFQDFEKQETAARKAASNQNEYANSKSGMGSSMSGMSGGGGGGLGGIASGMGSNQSSGSHSSRGRHSNASSSSSTFSGGSGNNKNNDSNNNNNNTPALNYTVRARNDNETDIVPDNTILESKEGSQLDNDRDLKNRQASSKGTRGNLNGDNVGNGFIGSGKVGSTNQGLELDKDRDIRHMSGMPDTQNSGMGFEASPFKSGGRGEHDPSFKDDNKMQQQGSRNNNNNNNNNMSGSRDSNKSGMSSDMSANIGRSGRTSNEAEKAQFGNDDDIVDYKKSGKGMKSGGAKDTIDVQQEQQDIEHRKEADSDRAPYSKTVKDGKNAKRAERAPGFLDAQS